MRLVQVTENYHRQKLLSPLTGKNVSWKLRYDKNILRLRTCVSRSSHRKCSKIFFCNIHRKTPVLESLFNCIFIKKSLQHVFSCEYCEIFKNTYFEKNLQTASTVNIHKLFLFQYFLHLLCLCI